MSTSIHIGVDFGGTNVKFGAFPSDAATVLHFTSVPLASLMDPAQTREQSPVMAENEKSWPPLLRRLIDTLSQFIKESKQHVSTSKSSSGEIVVQHVGISIKGLVQDGRILSDIGAGELLANIDLRVAFAKGLELAPSSSVSVDNDARCYAWGEYLFGAGKKFITPAGQSRPPKVMVCLTLGTGVGCGVIIDGKPYEGSSPLGGILGGHISINADGPTCPCGNVGCLELYCSATALQKAVLERHSQLHTKDQEGTILERFFDLVKSATQAKDQELSRQLFDSSSLLQTLHEFQRHLAIGIVNLIHAYSPDLVVVGGGLAHAAPVFLPGVEALVRRMAWTVPRGVVKIVAAVGTQDGAARGAAFLSQKARNKL